MPADLRRQQGAIETPKRERTRNPKTSRGLTEQSVTGTISDDVQALLRATLGVAEEPAKAKSKAKKGGMVRGQKTASQKREAMKLAIAKTRKELLAKKLPSTDSDVAKALGVHKSTVSRSVRGVICPTPKQIAAAKAVARAAKLAAKLAAKK